ncbi:MAG TPA: transglutaminase family protein, partial [Planctomycetota bacterium]|nr:transglutaminase family protein [Planctomycetota bacterium]
PLKYQRADALIRRLRDRVAVGGFLHHGQGKWYPGESLPRWALGLHWRRDGQSLWRDPSLVADESKPGGHTEADALRFIRRLAALLGVSPEFALPGYEDAWYHLWRERRLPINVDPHQSRLKDPEERARLAKVFEQGLDRPVGYALPLKRDHYSDGTREWVSGAWFFRPERMYLVPGDSPMGFRLPLDSLPWVSPTDYPHLLELDPMSQRPPLPDLVDLARQRHLRGAAAPKAGRGADPVLETGLKDPAMKRAAPGESAPWIVRTSLCAEARGGVLRLFVPPARDLEDYLDLIGAIEDTSAELELPVLVEGYAPPFDPRLRTIKVTPDPGVIEVNTDPAASWDELSTNTTALYEDARQTRLAAEKFMLDGRHTGTGGGNHIVLGGPTPSDSPLLRRPDLLKSLVGYWHNHPSLSYLFSGMFIGPTSQAPRVDEARNDHVYELEIAFRQVPEQGPPPPWLVDRIFRNLLTDATGNTHRSEFCIDKLYAPESSTGRLGLLEMRAFEMPPHARMSLAQHLLLRALVAKFWTQPYRRPLVRWRTEIHDRFLLPHFVRQDLGDVFADLAESSYDVQPEWFSPHFEFRFPRYGSIEHRGVELELRQAIEPWNVLGEEPAAGATVRYVDSSVERMQVLVNGMVDSRHVIACNGHRVPLHPTGTNGEFVGGIRYRAWQPPSCLHPTIGVHSPLVIDIVDTWTGRSIGGCTYHVAHPGGRSYDRFPVNASEAESRRIARFFKSGHTPGPMAVGEERLSKEFPFTLDLRRTEGELSS